LEVTDLQSAVVNETNLDCTFLGHVEGRVPMRPCSDLTAIFLFLSRGSLANFRTTYGLVDSRTASDNLACLVCFGSPLN